MTSGLLWRAAATVYASLYLFAFLAVKTLNRSAFRQTSVQAKKQLRATRDKLWRTDVCPNGLTHAFFECADGIKLHYVTNRSPHWKFGNSNLVIFLHGFPDSWIMWRTFLASRNLSEHSTLVALDLPGYGGSDGLPDYGATSVLEAVTAFVLAMREQHFAESYDDAAERGRVLLVGHDWGALIAYRLAAEAPMLADRFIVSNSILPNLAKANIVCRWSCAFQMLRDWRHNLRSIKLVRMAASNLAPVFRQMLKSGYVFVFNCLGPIAVYGGTFGDYLFLRMAHDYAAGANISPDSSEASEALASSLGPGIEQCISDSGYAEAVRRRAIQGPWAEQIRIYREGLATQRWEKSLQTLVSLQNIEGSGARRRSSSGTSLFDTGPEGALLAPTTVVWGTMDPVLDVRIALAGIRDYFCKKSQVVMLPECGHWLPLNQTGHDVLEAVILWAINGENDNLAGRLTASGLEGRAVVTAEK